LERYTSVFRGRDNEVIPKLLEVHCEVDDPLILDVTYNKGSMWKELNYRVLRMDIDPQFRLHFVGDFRYLPFKENSFDVLVFDPPHLPTNAASKNSSKMWERRYGITSKEGMGRDGDHVGEMFEPFLEQAKRVLKPGGLILAKLADLVHNHKYQWQHVMFINAVQSVGMTACDLMIKSDPAAGNLKSSKWNNVKHFRKNHCYWIVVRNSNRCERQR
jgi:SAM-dependent methyltransferase